MIPDYRNDSFSHPGHLFTFGSSREGNYLSQGTYSGQCAYFFFEKQPNVQNKSLTQHLLKKEQKQKL